MNATITVCYKKIILNNLKFMYYGNKDFYVITSLDINDVFHSN